MTDAMHGILAEAKKNRYSTIKDNLSEDDIASVWENVSSFIEKQMSQQKGVQIQSLGTFTFTQKKLEIGNNKFILIQRPVFNISEKLAQSQGLQYVKHHIPGQIPVVQLNYAAMSFESPYDRDTVENCVREILGAAQRAIGSKQNVELRFNGIGKLSIRDSKVKMKFFKEFINQMDGSGKLLDSLQNRELHTNKRPGTTDSVMSDRSCISRAQSSNTVILPKATEDEVENLLERLRLKARMSGTTVKCELENAMQSELEKLEHICRISNTSLNNGALPPVTEQNEDMDNLYAGQAMDMEYPPPQAPGALDDITMGQPFVNSEEGMEGFENEDVNTAAAIRNIEMEGEPQPLGQAGPMDTLRALNAFTDPDGTRPGPTMSYHFLPELEDLPEYATKRASIPPSRTGSRMAAPMAMATGVSLLDDLVPSAQTPKSAPSPMHRPSPPPGDIIGLNRQNSLLLSGHSRSASLRRSHHRDSLYKPHPPVQLAPLHRSHSLDQMKPGDTVNTPPSTACGHANAGQELCYLCHQRARRNIPVSFAQERKQREEEEDRLLQQYQYMKDAENVLNDQELQMAKRHNLQKMAAFNMGVSEAVHHKKRTRDTEFHRSYIFQRRPLTPPRFIKQEEYSGDLAKQVDHKESSNAKRQSDEEFLERLEQVQLAEDLAIQREEFLKDKADEQDKYKKALESQVLIKAQLANTDERSHPTSSNPSSPSTTLRLPFIPQAKTLRPFSEPSPARLNEDWKPFFGRLRFKPLQVPAREPDKEVFGKNDMTNEKMAERRRRAYEMFKDQQDLVAQRKREAILKRLAEQKEEEQVLDRTKNEMLDDRANRFTRRMHGRKRLEDDWIRASMVKKERLAEDQLRAMSPGVLLHEQCDKYGRCAQCKRTMKNCGESNLWSESRYIPGSRLMV